MKGTLISKNDFPSIEKLCERIIEHRSKCPLWGSLNPCFDCHYGLITPIEKELEKIKIKIKNGD